MSAGSREGGSLRVLQPAGWPAPKGYANGVAASGGSCSSGQIWNASQQFESDDFVVQARQALAIRRGACRGWRAAK
jgi:enamine deaminase RidA (YjgF/YER057c/UK114 family)